MSKLTTCRWSLYQWLCWGAIGGFCIWMILHLGFWLLNPFPNEFREGASLDIVDLIRRGINPFSEDTHISFFYMYGFVNSYLIAAVSWLFGNNGYILHRSLSLISMAVASSMMVYYSRRLKFDKLSSVLVFLMIFTSGWVMCEANARPDQLGFLIYILILTTAQRLGRNYYGLAVLAFLTVIELYIKQYFILVGVTLFIYLFLKSKKMAVVYAVMSGCLLLLSIWVVNLIFPYYFVMSFLSFIETGSGSWTHFFKQTVVFGIFYWPLLLLCIWLFISKYKLCPTTITIKKFSFPFFRVFVPQKKTLESDINVSIFEINFICIAVFLLHLGKAVGAFLTYYYQLLLPSVVILGMYTLSCKLHGSLKKYAFAFVIFCSLWHCGLYNYGALFTPTLSKGERIVWNQAYDLLGTCAGEEVCIDTSIFVDYAINSNISYYDNGLTSGAAWVDTSCKKIDEINPGIVKCLFPAAPEITNHYNTYRNSLFHKIRDKEFKMVVTSSGNNGEIYDLLQGGYSLKKTFMLRTGRQGWKYDFWIRK